MRNFWFVGVWIFGAEAALKADNRRTIECMVAMADAMERVQAGYPNTHPTPVAELEAWADQESLARSSDFNRTQLKFNLSGGLGMR